MRGIILIRHAESIKNLKDIQGGEGESLTVKGIEQAEKVVGVLRSYIPFNLYSLPSIHTIETTEIIAKLLGISYKISPILYPLNLGVINGMSNDEVSKNYPNIFENLLLWRERKIEICDLNIPGMESASTFWERGKQILNIFDFEKMNCLICTNSVAILLLNMLKGRNIDRGNGYKHIKINNCDYAIFEKDIGNNFILTSTTIGDI